jgi:hypothetical protein
MIFNRLGLETVKRVGIFLSCKKLRGRDWENSLVGAGAVS